MLNLEVGTSGWLVNFHMPCFTFFALRRTRFKLGRQIFDHAAGCVFWMCLKHLLRLVSSKMTLSMPMKVPELPCFTCHHGPFRGLSWAPKNDSHRPLKSLHGFYAVEELRREVWKVWHPERLDIHRIDVWYIYLHLDDFYGKLGEYAKHGSYQKCCWWFRNLVHQFEIW